MQNSHITNIQGENDIKKIVELVIPYYQFFIICIIISLTIAFFINRYSVPAYNIASSILIKGNTTPTGSGGGVQNDFLYGNLFGGNQNLQNELWIMKSYPVIEKTVKNLDLTVTYYRKGKFNLYETYTQSPFKVSFLTTHPQPINIRMLVSFRDEKNFYLTAEAKNAAFWNFEMREITHRKEKWTFKREGKLGELIETPDLAFIIEPRDSLNTINTHNQYGFKFSTLADLSSNVERSLQYTVVDRQATVIKITLMSESTQKGIDILNELMNVYSEQNLERKNHLATITIDYIEKQLSEISDSLALAEDNLQRFRSNYQLLDISNQATGISSQYMDLQNQLAELDSRKKYFDYVSDLLKNDNFSNMMLPASIGISDQLLNDLMTQLMTATAQRTTLIQNNQERNPLVQSLGLRIENLKETITESINAISNTTSISIDEMKKRIKRIESEINRLPATQRQLGTIERKYRLNDAIYSYLMEKHSEAKITKASNLPDDIVIEPAKTRGLVTPKRQINYMIAFFLGLAVPFGFILMKNALKKTVESQDELEHLVSCPVLGKIMHNKYKSKNIMFEFPNSDIAESFRALRTNLDFYAGGRQKMVILVTSSIENEGKSFVSMNLAMSYAQLGCKTVLVDCDLRKSKIYFRESEETQPGLSSYMINKLNLEDLINRSPHENLDYIVAGILPPNPVELLALDKTKKLITRLKNDYDVVILDSTPLAQVTDAYLLIDHSDLRIVVARNAYTLKKVFSMVMKDLSLKNIGATCIVLNDNKALRDQYGYGYGYHKKKGFFERMYKKKRKEIK